MGREQWKKIWVGSAGNMVEWFDWFVYASFAVYFADAFFPKGNETANLMNTIGHLRRRLLHAAGRRLAARPHR